MRWRVGRISFPVAGRRSPWLKAVREVEPGQIRSGSLLAPYAFLVLSLPGGPSAGHPDDRRVQTLHSSTRGCRRGRMVLGVSQVIKEDLGSAVQGAQAVAALREEGPTLGRPLVDRLKGARIHHLKELRPGSRGRSEIRIIFASGPARSALLLPGGDKAGDWQRWYRDNIPLAEQLYLDYTAEDQE